MGRLQGKVAIVTGAGGGIGTAISRQFAYEGAAVVGIDVDAGALARMAAAVRAAGSGVSTLSADVADETTAVDAVACALAEFGRLDVLVSNAVYDVRVDNGDHFGHHNDGNIYTDAAGGGSSFSYTLFNNPRDDLELGSAVAHINGSKAEFGYAAGRGGCRVGFQVVP